MADAIVSVVLEQLTSFALQEIRNWVGRVLGARSDVEKLTRNLRSIQAVLMDAEEKQVKEKDVRVWLDELREASYDMDDILDEWNTKIVKLQIQEAENASTDHIKKNKVCLFFPSVGFHFRRVVLACKMAPRIKDIKERLDTISKEKEKFKFNVTTRSINQPQNQRVKTTSFVDMSEIYGREEEKHALVSKLLSESNGERNEGPRIISIVGMGGIGKTTLAQLAYNSNEVACHFDRSIWVCVSDPFDEVKIAKAIIETLIGAFSSLGELQSLLENIRTNIVGKKFLLVLDDVWSEEYDKWGQLYNCLKHSAHGSKILVTTRKETVAKIMGSSAIISIAQLSEEKCWTLFTHVAFFHRSPKECEQLEDIGRRIVGKCKGLPLAAKTIGGLLRLKNTRAEWEKILKSELWEIEKFEENLLPTLLLSYNDLPFNIRRCFSYCAIFPKDYIMDKNELIRLWMAQGYLGLEQNKELRGNW